MKKCISERKLLLIAFIFVFFGLIITLVSTFISSENSKLSELFGIISTCLSILLSFVSIIYTFISGSQSTKLIESLEKQNKSLVSELNKVGENYNNQNIKDAFD